MNDIEYKWKNKESYSKRALFWIRLANEKIDELNRQLLGLSFLLLPLTASIAITNIPTKEFQKTLIIVSWFFLFFSIIFGLIQIAIDANYFKLLSRDSSRRESIWADFTQSISNLERKTKSLGYMQGSSTFVALCFQIFTIFIGILLIMIVAGTILITK